MTASTNARKGNVAASVNRSKYGGTGTMYASARSRSNILSSASKRSVNQAEKAVVKPPVQVCKKKIVYIVTASLCTSILLIDIS